MVAVRLQRWLDALRDTSPQRWAIGSLAVLAVAVAQAVTRIGTGQVFGWFGVFVVALATISAVQAGSHTSTLTIAFVVVDWLAAVDDIATPRSIVVATCLLVFHGALALMAVTAHSASVDMVVVRRWVWRSVVVVAATAAIWLLVRVFERRDAAANPLLTLFALAALGAIAVALRQGSVNEPAA